MQDKICHHDSLYILRILFSTFLHDLCLNFLYEMPVVWSWFHRLFQFLVYVLIPHAEFKNMFCFFGEASDVVRIALHHLAAFYNVSRKKTKTQLLSVHLVSGLNSCVSNPHVHTCSFLLPAKHQTSILLYMSIQNKTSRKMCWGQVNWIMIAKILSTELLYWNWTIHPHIAETAIVWADPAFCLSVHKQK